MNPTQVLPVRQINRYVRIPAEGVHLLADLHVPEEASALVILAHEGRGRHNPRSRHSARIFRDKGLGTLVCDLLTDEEARDDDTAAEEAHDVTLLAKRLVAVTRWAASNPDTEDLRIGYFGARAGGAAALIAAAQLGDTVGAVVTRGGRLDLATCDLADVVCPTLVIVGENDAQCLEISRQAFSGLSCRKEFKVLSGASHSFGEPGKLESMAQLSADWLRNHLGRPVHFV